MLYELDEEKGTTYTSQPKRIDTAMSEHGIATERINNNVIVVPTVVQLAYWF
jgi:hypothetical protein